MKKRSSSRGSPEASDSGAGQLNVPQAANNTHKSGAASAPTTPIKTRGSVAGTTMKHKSEEIAETFLVVNERPVDDISLDFFYKPHTITLLAVSALAVMYFAFVR